MDAVSLADRKVEYSQGLQVTPCKREGPNSETRLFEEFCH